MVLRSLWRNEVCIQTQYVFCDNIAHGNIPKNIRGILKVITFGVDHNVKAEHFEEQQSVGLISHPQADCGGVWFLLVDLSSGRDYDYFLLVVRVEGCL